MTVTGPSTPTPAPPAVSAGTARARATAVAFEAVLIGQMTAQMLDSARPTGDFAGGHGEDMFRGVLAEKIGTEIAKHGGIGVAQAVFAQILLLQQGSKNGE